MPHTESTSGLGINTPKQFLKRSHRLPLRLPKSKTSTQMRPVLRIDLGAMMVAIKRLPVKRQHLLLDPRQRLRKPSLSRHARRLLPRFSMNAEPLDLPHGRDGKAPRFSPFAANVREARPVQQLAACEHGEYRVAAQGQLGCGAGDAERGPAGVVEVHEIFRNGGMAVVEAEAEADVIGVGEVGLCEERRVCRGMQGQRDRLGRIDVGAENAFSHLFARDAGDLQESCHDVEEDGAEDDFCIRTANGLPYRLDETPPDLVLQGGAVERDYDVVVLHSSDLRRISDVRVAFVLFQLVVVKAIEYLRTVQCFRAMWTDEKCHIGSGET